MSTISTADLHIGFVRREAYVIRDAGLADLKGLMAVEKVSQPSPWSARVFEKEFELDYSHVWLVEAEGAVVAFLVFWTIYDEIHILNVAVAPEFRRRGIAQDLITSLIERAGEEMTSITLEVRVGNVGARRLYEGFGFRVIGHRKQYYADNGEDAAVMALLLDDELREES